MPPSTSSYPFSKVVVMGLGYVGLPTASLIASKKIEVLGVDISPEIVKGINEGKVHFSEPDLDGLVHKVVSENFLKADISPQEADVFIITVPTPFKENKEPELKYVESAIEKLLPYLEEGNLIIIESTSPIGTTERMYSLITRERKDLEGKIYMAYCPERVLPGRILYELEYNDRVIGGINEESSQKAAKFYKIFVKGELHLTNARTAEMCKLVENAYRDVNIAFANELSIIADKEGINIWELIDLANKHPRVNILKPGVGVGGHCIPVDPWFIITQHPKEAKLMRIAREVNTYKTHWVIEKIKKEVEKLKKKSLKEPLIACLGLTYKPDVDDLRESPALYIAQKLIKEGYNVAAVEPNIEGIEGIPLISLEEAIEKADLLVLLVPHKEFTGLEKGERRILSFATR